jgi:chemotaxis protein MotB
MFNISEISEVNLNLVLSAFRGSFSVYTGGQTLTRGVLADMGMTVQSLPSKEAGNKMDKAIKRAMALLEAEVKTKQVQIRETKRGLVISLVGNMFFEPGSATLLPGTKEILDKVARLILDMKNYMNMDNKVEVEGYADSGQIKPTSPYYELFPTNLDLSGARANNVIKYFWASGVDPTRIRDGQVTAKFKSVAYGEFQPLEPNISPEQRAYNRRVDIIIVRQGEE